MNYKHWQPVRIVVLGCCSLGIACAIAINLFAKTSIARSFKHSIFEEWETINTDKIHPQNKAIAGWRERQEVANQSLITEV